MPNQSSPLGRSLGGETAQEGPGLDRKMKPSNVLKRPHVAARAQVRVREEGEGRRGGGEEGEEEGMCLRCW